MCSRVSLRKFQVVSPNFNVNTSMSLLGKLGLVTAENRAPRLVVDSTISGVTSNTCIPNRMLLPKILDVLKAAPLNASATDMIAFTLDVSKAHRRIKIAPVDQGLLCFWFQDTLFKSKTLNFGARASGYFWARVAGLMVRTLHQVLHIQAIHCFNMLMISLCSWRPRLLRSGLAF